MQFNFRELQKKYTKVSKKQQEEKEGEQLRLYEDVPENKELTSFVKKIDKDFTKYHNGHRYYYLHKDEDQFDPLDKLKKDQFQHIRKEYETTLVKDVHQKGPARPAKAKKKMTKAERELRFRHFAYLFRKNIKIIIQKLRKNKITVKDIFEQQLFTDKPYQFSKSIFEAVKSGEDTKVWRYYIQNKFVVYSVDSTGKTPLIWACIRGYASIATMLIDMGALLNKKDMLGHDAIYYAIYYKHEECLKVVLLNLATLSEEDLLISKQSKRFMDIVNLCQSIMGIIQKMPYEKRRSMFETRLNHLV